MAKAKAAAPPARRHVSFVAALPETGTVYSVNAEGLGKLTLEAEMTAPLVEAVAAGGWMRKRAFVVTVSEEPEPAPAPEEEESES